jgi:putative transcription factor
MSYQDFKEITFKKNNESTKKGSYIIVSKLEKELLKDDEIPHLKMFGKENGNILQNARTARKLTQEQLANQINEKRLIINQYELGNVLPDNKVLNKLRRLLNIKFN